MSYVIGLNSGSSFDGIDAVLLEFEDSESMSIPRVVAGVSTDWPNEVKEMVLRAFSNDLTIYELTRLNYVVGALFAEAAIALMEQENLTSEDVDLIGYDGQTIYQEPPVHDTMRRFQTDERLYKKWSAGGFACGLQIGEPGVVAALVDVPVVSQFRSVDHALGGTGAPLMQFFDYILFRENGPTVSLNIGGISNLQLAMSDRSKMKAFDCGPGVIMIDQAMRRLYNRNFDEDGAVAARGSVIPEMLTELMSHPFFTRAIPRCAWRLDFGADYADSMLKKYGNHKAEDLITTITKFSAEAIISSYLTEIEPVVQVSKVIASGGGAMNPTLMGFIKESLPRHVDLVTSDEIGIPLQFKEAAKFATLAFATRLTLANNIPAASGASEFATLGKLVMPPSAAKIDF